MRKFLVLLTFISIFSGSAQADPMLPEHRLIVHRDADFPGGDVQSIFDTSFEACESACYSRNDCAAFTYNTRSAACFLKDQVNPPETYAGAYSVEVEAVPAALRAAAEARGARLDFLTSGDLASARSRAANLPYDYAAGGFAADQLDGYAREAEASGNISGAMRNMAAKVVLTDAAADWAEFARLANANAQNTEANDTKRSYFSIALDASISAYLRAERPALQARTLAEMAVALEGRGRGRLAIPALRLAHEISPREDIASALDRVAGLYGFRVVETTVSADSAQPRICTTFSEDLVAAGVDYAPFVQSATSGLAVSAEGRQLCVDGIEHGQRYTLTLRVGLPAATGETLLKPVELNQYVRDRAPAVYFSRKAYVLPAAPDAGLPVVTVNAPKLNISLSHVSDRNLIQLYQQGYFGTAMDPWSEEWFNETLATPFWSGTAEVKTDLNRDVTTRLPIGDALKGQPPGLYVLQASVPGTDPYDVPSATQWFVVSDIGLTTLDGADGLTVFVRSLSSAAAMEGATVQLVSEANDVLGEVVTDAKGYAHFAEGMTTGTGSAAPSLVVVKMGDDLTFLSLSGPAFDLSDRGVAGPPSAPPIDVYLTTDRGAYRAGEVIHATAMARDGTATAIEGLPVTAVLSRPDGVEYSRQQVQDAGVGGYVIALPLAGNAPRGTWRLDLHADPDAPALASSTLLVEDFLPERIDFDMALPEGPIALTNLPTLSVDARYLFGAPGADLAVEGSLRLKQARQVAGWPGYQFGRYDDVMPVRWGDVPMASTDATGHADLDLSFPEVAAKGVPLTADITLMVKEGSGRPVERTLSTDLLPAGPMIGIKPDFDGSVPNGSVAGFNLIALNPDLSPKAMEVSWAINRISTRYQWYSVDGYWSWDPVTTRERVASGEVSLGETPVSVSAPTDWGEYELVVTETGGTLSSSVSFYAGWYAPADTTSTPDMLDVSLDAKSYAPGETATLRFVPRSAGKALVTVMSNRLIDMVAVDATAGENTLTLPVTDDWGAGAYVTVTLIQPLTEATGHEPTRALGLSYATVDPGARQLRVAFEAPVQAAPRGPLDLVLNVEGIAEGDTAYATIAAVDQGILNLTSFAAPDPSDHYFGQRRLGMAIRDLYGRLIDGRSGEMGVMRSGGDEMGQMRMQATPPTEELMAQFSGPIEVVNGKAVAHFDLPAFNGTVKLMAVVWSKAGLGNANADVLVRDPVVMTASLPRSLAPGDEARLLLELTHAEGPTGAMHLSVTSDAVAGGSYETDVALDSAGQTARLSVPVTAPEVGLHQFDLVLETPDGKQLTKTLTLPVELLDPEVAQTSRLSLAPGESFTLSRDIFAELMAPHASITAGPLARMDVAGLITLLDRYPYGCTEQQTSRALPLIYLGGLASTMGLSGPEDVTTRVDKAITAVLANQAAAGSFGLWSPGSDDMWLDAYVSDFLSRARAEGYSVPDTAFRAAMDNLRNEVNYYPDFETGGQDLAYALYVLAREGAAAMGDLRYFADVKPEAFTTPLASAHLGAALAAYGDPTRADRMFAQASQLLAQATDEGQFWRDDYGTDLRDAAGVLALATEAGSDAVDREALISRIARAGARLSTQEATWSLLAARALVDEAGHGSISYDGAALTSPLVQVADGAALAAPHVIRNDGTAKTDLTVTSYGVPEVPPAAGGNGYAIERRYFTMEGDPVDVASVEQGTRLVTVLTVTPWTKTKARLMISDPLPGGFEIDNPNLLRAGDIAALDWLEVTNATETTEFRQDRFLAAVNWSSKSPIRLAYIVRAVTPGSFRHPAATVEDMYRPTYRANGEADEVVVTE